MRSWGTIGLLLLCATAAFAGSPAPKPGRIGSVTPYRQMVKDLQADAARSPLVRLASLGRTAGHRDIWMARVADPTFPAVQTVRVVVLCRQHGDEPASTEAVLSLLHRVATDRDPALRANLGRLTLYLIPMVNPDGAEAMTRRNGAGVDLNRDWGVFTQPETRAVARAVAFIGPHVVVDAHNWDGTDKYNAHCIEVARTLGVKETPLGEAARDLQQDAVAQLARSGYQVQSTAYGAEADTRLAHRYFARQGRLSFLVETHSGDPRDVADFQQRQGLYSALIHALARRYGGENGGAQRLALTRLDGGLCVGTQDARLFPTITAHPKVAHAPRPSRMWLAALCLYAFALWASAQGLRLPPLVPAPAGRPGPRRYHC